MIQMRTALTDQYADRPEAVDVDTVVIHTMYHPQAEAYFSPELCLHWLQQCGVSAHYLIDRGGEVWRAVPEEALAWHAGPSRMPFPHDSREKVNDFSLGIELLATESSGITEQQMTSLECLLRDVSRRWNIRAILGHNHIAPLRKTDPWGFDWAQLNKRLSDLNCFIPTTRV